MSPEEYQHALRAFVRYVQKAGLDPTELCERLDQLGALRAYEDQAGIPERDRLAAAIARGDWAERTQARIAVVTDIHGNYEGLRAALEDSKAQGCERIVCLGDMVDGGEGNDEVVRALMAEGATTVLGNHDEFNDLSLAGDVQAYIDALPETVIEGNVVYTHVSPRERVTKIRSPYDAWSVFEEVRHRLTFVGHAHISYIYGERCERSVSATEHEFEFNVPFELDPTDRYVIGVGAVGYPRDGLRRIRYGIYDQRADTIEIRALEGPLLDF